MSAAGDKGALLEEGVRVIEQAIVTAGSDVRASDLVIEARKIINHQGVRHEIDLKVDIHKPSGYDATFIFECKNWKDRVGKNEIVVFSEKIRVTNAQRGFFIATAFTDDAVAQAKQDGRMQLVSASAEQVDAVQRLAFFHFMEVRYGDIGVNFYMEGAAADSNREPINVATAVAMLDARAIDLNGYFAEWRDQAQNRRTATWTGHEDGEYALVAEERREFLPGQLVVNGSSYASATIRVEMVISITYPRVVAKVDVDGRGVAIKLEPVKIAGGEFQTWLAFTRRPQ